MADDSKSSSLKIIFVLFLIFSTNGFFNLGPWWHKSGVFNIADVGNAMIWLSLPFILAFNRDRQILWNPISGLILFYLLFIVLQIFLAYANYGQSLFDGLVGIRHQFFYLSFFIFILLLDSTEIIRMLLDILAIIAIILVFLAVLNYMGLPLFYYKWAEGQGMRAGIVRAYIPGMSLITFSLIWIFTRWLFEEKNRTYTFLTSVFLLAALFFRQTRMRILSVSVVVSIMLIMRRKWRHLLFFVLLVFVSTGVIQVTMKKNIITEPFILAYENFTKKSGTWSKRLSQLKVDIREFKYHPWIGSGLSAMRSVTAKKGTRLQHRMSILSYKSDLGYTHWMKLYGITGIIWLILYFSCQIVMAIKAQRRLSSEDRILAVFALSHLGYLMMALITLNYLMMPAHMLIFILNTAIIVRLYWNSHYASVAR